jgi:hypothetical protein
MPGGSTRHTVHHHPVRVAALLLLVVAGAAIAAPEPAAAAAGLAFSASARYELIPVERRVHVTVDAAVTSLTPDSATQRFYYTGISIGAPPGTANPSATSGGAEIGAAITEATADFATIEVTFGHAVFYQQTYRFSVGFDMVDAGGEARRDVRIGAAFAAFPVWAFGDEGTPANVTVAIPPAFDVNLLAGTMDETPDGGGTLLSAGAGEDAGSFFAYVTAEEPDARVVEQLNVPVGDEIAEIEIGAWPDDQAWVDLVRPLLVDGLPVLSEQIGLPYPIPFKLRVSEQAFERLGDYGGVFDPETDAIEIRYDADAFVTLHESSHIWFNGALFEDRWIGESFASYYAEVAARELAISVEPFTLTDELRTEGFPLNEWGLPGREDSAREDYAYAATNELARQIAARAGADGLRAVWVAADATAYAYQPIDADTPEVGEARLAAGWQRLLDLLEERTDADFDDLWIAFVVSDSQLPLLDDRTDARAEYAGLVADADGWPIPRPLRNLMGAWSFDRAHEEIAGIEAVFDARDTIVDRAAELDLSVPPDMRDTFAMSGTGAAEARADDELRALDEIERATARLQSELLPVEWVGLIGASAPGAALADARAAYEAGDATDATSLAHGAAGTRSNAAAHGRERVIIAGGGLLGLDAAAMGGLLLRRSRRLAQA